jgi:hypothetical protein
LFAQGNPTFVLPLNFAVYEWSFIDASLFEDSSKAPLRCQFLSKNSEKPSGVIEGRLIVAIWAP